MKPAPSAKAKRPTPSWGITKADLMRMHAAEVDKLNAKIKALEAKPPTVGFAHDLLHVTWNNKYKKGFIALPDLVKLIKKYVPEMVIDATSSTEAAPDARMKEAVSHELKMILWADNHRWETKETVQQRLVALRTAIDEYANKLKILESKLTEAKKP